MSAFEITSQEYYAECEALAKGACEEAKGDREAAFDALHETIASHQWVIYTRNNWAVLWHSSHEEAYFEENGATEVDSLSDIMSKCAFYAFLTDAHGYLETALEDWESEHSDV